MKGLRFSTMRSAVAGLVLLVVACAPPAATAPTSSATVAPKPTAAAPSGKVVIARPTDINELDSHITFWFSDAGVLLSIFDGLVLRDNDLSLKPGLAESWRSQTPTEWVFTLRSGVLFHNGEPFDASAAKVNIDDTIKRQKDPMWGTLSAAEVVNERTLKITTKTADPLLPARLTNLVMYAPKYFQQVGPAEFKKKPVGTGPFKFVEWVKDSYAKLEANTTYWRGSPKINEVIFRVIPEASTRLSALRAGEVDVISGMPNESFDTVNKTQGLKALGAASTRPLFVMMFPGSPEAGGQAIKDPRVRQAINYATNVDGIIANILGGRATRIAGITPTSLDGYDASVKPYAYDPTKAKQLLADAGFANGFDLTMFVPSGRYIKGEDVLQAIAADLGKVGIKAQVRPIESGTLFKLRDDKKIAPLFLFAWGSNLGDAGEVPLAVLHSTSSNAMYSSPAIDRLLNDAGTTIDPAARKQILSQLQQQVKEEAPFLFLYTNEELYGVSDRLVGWKPRPDDRILMWDVTLAR